MQTNMAQIRNSDMSGYHIVYMIYTKYVDISSLWFVLLSFCEKKSFSPLLKPPHLNQNKLNLLQCIPIFPRPYNPF